MENVSLGSFAAVVNSDNMFVKSVNGMSKFWLRSLVCSLCWAVKDLDTSATLTIHIGISGYRRRRKYTIMKRLLMMCNADSWQLKS